MKPPLLRLNCFPTELSSERFDLPYFDCQSWEASTHQLSETYARFQAYRQQVNDNQIRVFLLNGPEIPETLSQTTVDISELPHLGMKLIHESLARYFRIKGLSVSRENRGSRKVLKTTPQYNQEHLEIRCGISFQVHHPFAEQPYGFAISVQWEVSPVFKVSIADPMLRDLAEGMAVLYKPETPRNESPTDLRQYYNRYLGHVLEIPSGNQAIVSCKDNEVREIPLTDLFLEASPSAIHEYESQAGLSGKSHSVWLKIQELNFVLNPNRRRNPSVLMNRLRAIRNFLGASSKEQLVVPLCCFERGVVSIGLTPAKVEVV